jgi:GNAT superfamily N-acetyltransferase
VDVKAMSKGDEPAAIATIALAFAADPATRWTWPEPRQFLDAMPGFIQAIAGGAFAHGGAFCTDRYAGVALWLPPGVRSDADQLAQHLESTASSTARADAPALFKQIAAYHPDEPHWYLPLIGVDPACQGKGLGHVLMSFATVRFDRERLPAYLESSNPRNISFYQRHGFESLGTIQAGSSPPIVPMLRRPR